MRVRACARARACVCERSQLVISNIAMSTYITARDRNVPWVPAATGGGSGSGSGAMAIQGSAHTVCCTST